MKLIRLATIASSICSALVGCAGVERPDADICIVNFASDKPAHLHCYNVKNDFTDDGTMKTGARGHDVLIKTPGQLNAGKFISKEDWAKYQVWINDIRNYARLHCSEGN